MIKGVLQNFLGTFMSRHSDFDGYWLFGFLVENLDQVKIDLLDSIQGDAVQTPLTFARQLAVQRFAEQMAKAGLPNSWFQEACLTISKQAQTALVRVNGQNSIGYNLKFLAEAITDLGKPYRVALSVFVAPHDPKVELRSVRAT